uniref:peptidylprolyl isomerase n=1 Tax=Esox lucius TaxID=8010 RepID=A0A6Q2ZLM8_ESOLU
MLAAVALGFIKPSLASLFGLDQAASQGNESFQYTAPKQPRKTSNPGPPTQKPTPPPGAPLVLLATAIHAFKYLNGQYQKQGKLGAAVLGNHTTKDYKLLLYAGQQKQVTAAKIHVGFVFTVQPSNYCTFYDDQRQNWSLMFDTEKAAVDFCKEVCLAKVNSAPFLEVVVVQDLALGEGQAVESGDSLEVAYTGWLLQNHAVGQMFDSNMNKDKLLRLKLGAGKVIKGWEDGMLGMRKSGRRLIVIPASLGYGSHGVANRVPPDSTLIFEAELRRVKLAKDSGSDHASSGSRDSAAPSPAPSVENLGPDLPAGPAQPSASNPGREPPLWAKSNSISEQLTVSNPDATKAKLISRMAKMGQPMLPFMAGPSSQPDSSDSEMEVRWSVQGLLVSHPHGVPPSALMPVAMTTAAPQPIMAGSAQACQVTMTHVIFIQLSDGLTPFHPYTYPPSSMASSQIQPMGQMYPTQTVPYMGGAGEVTSFLMTEARQHNTEIRLAVGKVADKVDQLASKVENLQRQGGQSLAMPSVTMETSMIMHNIQRIIQENESLKKDVYEKSARIEEQNRKIGELIHQNQRYMEQSNLLMEQRNDTLKSSSEHNQARVLQAEQDKVEYGTTSCPQPSLVLSQQGQCSVRLCQAPSDHSLKETAERGQAQYRTEKQKRKEMELRVNNVEEELQDLKTDKEGVERTLLDRKRKWQAERQRCDEEMEELRRVSQQDLTNLRTQLHKARTNTGQAASEQLAQLQAELEEDWKGRCAQALALAKEQHGRAIAELAEQRDTLEQSLTQKNDPTVNVSTHNVLHGFTLVFSWQVKRVMNGVFHSLRAEFDLHDTYTGSAVLGVIVNTIKSVTLQLLNSTEGPSSHQRENKEEEEDEEEEEEEEEDSNERQAEERPLQDVKVNGQQEEEQRVEPEQPGESPGQREGDPRNVQERVYSEVVPETEKPTGAEPEEAIHPEPEHQPHSPQPRPTSSDMNPEENMPSVMGTEMKLESDASPSEEKKISVTVEDSLCELDVTSPKATGPPAHPPLPPNLLNDSSGQVTR